MSTSILRAIEDYLKSDKEEQVLMGFTILNSIDVDIKYKLLVLRRAGFEKAPVTEDGKPVKGKYIGFNSKFKRYHYSDNEFSDCSNYILPMGLYQQLTSVPFVRDPTRVFKLDLIVKSSVKLFNDK